MLAQETLKRIGSVAKESGLPIKTIRYYDELGLLKILGRTEGNYRLFSSDVFGRLRFIKRAQSLGLTLLEIREFLTVHDQGDLPCDHIKIKLEEKLSDIEQQIYQLQILKLELQGLLSEANISGKSDTVICPLIQQD